MKYYEEFNDTRWHFRPPSATLNTTEDKPEEPPVPRPRPHCVAPPRTTDSEIRSKALPRAACSLSLSDHNPNVAGRSKPGHCRVPGILPSHPSPAGDLIGARWILRSTCLRCHCGRIRGEISETAVVLWRGLGLWSRKLSAKLRG